MPLEIIRADITTLDVDAIVCPTNRHLRPGTGVDRAIRIKCGLGVENALSRLDMCEVGEAVYIDGYSLPCKYIIYTVGPKWCGGENGEKEKLECAYLSSLNIALTLGLKSVAFPLISTGYYSFPKELALRIASDTIFSFLADHDMNVLLVVYDDKAFRISHELFNDVKEYIDSNFEPAICEPLRELEDKVRYQKSVKPGKKMEWARREAAPSLDEVLREVRDESFSEMLFRKIAEKNMSDVECYRKANIDRKLFSKIRSNGDYKPSKSTALALALALNLEWDELVEMVSKAGYSMSKSNVGDIIIKYFVDRGEYNVITINETLFAYDQVMLGQRTQ